MYLQEVTAASVAQRDRNHSCRSAVACLIRKLAEDLNGNLGEIAQSQVSNNFALKQTRVIAIQILWPT
jgi:hypothetical protein